MNERERWQRIQADGGAFVRIVSRDDGGLLLEVHEGPPSSETVARTRGLGMPAGWLSQDELAELASAEADLSVLRREQNDRVARVAAKFLLNEAAKP